MVHGSGYVLLGLLTFFTSYGSCDYFTAVVGLEQLVSMEELFVEYLEEYMEKVEQRNEHIELFLTAVEQDFLDVMDDPLRFYGNPINSFKIMHKFTVDWQQQMRMVLNAPEVEALKKDVEELEAEFTKPTNDDLMGAGKGMLRLQETYALEAAEIANGTLIDVKCSLEMSASECFQMGRVSYELQEYHYAIPWLIEAQVSLEHEMLAATDMWQLPPITDYVRILELLATAMSNIGNHKMAARYIADLLLIDVSNQFALENKELYERNVLFDRHTDPNEQQQPISVKPPKTEVEVLYERLCREEVMRTPAEVRYLRCRYVSNNVPFCLIAPFKMEELSLDPFVAYYHEAIYDSEIDTIIETTEHTVERSKVGDATESIFSDVRTSKNSWLWFHLHSFLDNIKQRLMDITGLNLETGEALQVANYGIGGHYGPHYDFVEREVEKTFPGRGNRILTALFYINDVEMGGSTVFPFLRLFVPPIRRSLIVWYNMHESLEVDYRTKHAGCPVLKGSKWICNEWFHEFGQEFTRPCSLQQLGYKSIEYKDKL